MKITQSLKPGNFDIFSVTFKDLLELYYASKRNEKLRKLIYLALLESLDNDKVKEKHGYSAVEYLENLGLKKI